MTKNINIKNKTEKTIPKVNHSYDIKFDLLAITDIETQPKIQQILLDNFSMDLIFDSTITTLTNESINIIPEFAINPSTRFSKNTNKSENPYKT